MSKNTSIGLSYLYEQLLYGDSCSYEINAPQYVSNSGDLIRLKINKLDYTEAFYFQGTSFQNITSSKQLQANEQIVVKHPNRIYLYFVSNSIINGNFTFEAQYLPVINNTQAAQNSWLNYNSSNQSVLTAYSNQYKLIKSQVHGEKKFIDSIDHSKLVIAVVVILLALIMISLSIAFLIAVKRSPKQQLSQQIVRSVQNQEEAQQLNNMDQSSQFLNVGNSPVSKIFKNQYHQEEFKDDSRKYNFDGSGSDRAPQKGQFLPDINQSALNQQQVNDFLAEFNRLHEMLNDDQKRELAQRFGKQNKFGPQQQTILEDANEDYEYDTESDSGENQEDKKSRLYRQLEAIRKILRDDDDMLRHQYTDKDDIDEIKRSEGDYNSIRSSQIAEEDEDNKMDMRMTRAKFFTFSDNKNASASKDDSAVVQHNTDQKNMFHNTKPKDHNFGMSKTDANFFKPQSQMTPSNSKLKPNNQIVNESILRKSIRDELMNLQEEENNYGQNDFNKTNIIEDDQGVYLQSFNNTKQQVKNKINNLPNLQEQIIEDKHEDNLNISERSD